MTRCCLWIGAGLIGLCASSVSFAQGQPCSDGSWLCESNSSKSADVSSDSPSGGPSAVLVEDTDASKLTPPEQPANSSGQQRAKGPSAGGKKRGNQGKPARRTKRRIRLNPSTVVVYQNSVPSPTVVVVRSHPRVIPSAPPPKPKPLRHRMWGMNVRLSGAVFQAEHDSSGMGGVGVGGRVRPVSLVAVELGLDFIGGRDYYGRQRFELPVSGSAILYVNPSKPLQFYVLGGLMWSSAFVKDLHVNEKRTYAYLGGQLGPGLELRFSPGVSGNLDIIGFIRSRVDSDARRNPEFRDDSSGRYSNTSAGALFRMGLTAYF